MVGEHPANRFNSSVPGTPALLDIVSHTVLFATSFRCLLSHRVRTCNDLAKQIANFIRCLRIVFTESLYSGKSYSCCCLDRIAPLDCCGVPGTVSIQGRALRSPWNNRFQRETAMRFVRLTLVDRATRYFCLTSLAHVVFICHRSLSSFCCSPLNHDR
jgi:hypothetical protein